MSSPFQTRRRVEFAETDMAGIAHFSNFFRWMESAEVDFLQARGLSVALPWEGEKIGFPRVSASCDYIHPVQFMDFVDIFVQIERLGKKSVTYRFDFSHQGAEVARGRITACCCRVRREDGRIESIEIPPSLRNLLEQNS